MFPSSRNRGNSPLHQRQLAHLRRLTRTLIQVANQEDRRQDSERRSPRQFLAVRALAERSLLESVQYAVDSGLGRDAIRSEGIERAVSETLVMSDLAYRVVGQLRTRVDDLAVATDRSRRGWDHRRGNP